MSNETPNDGSHSFLQLEESATRQIGFLKVIIGGLGTLLVVAFVIGINWASLQRYEERVDNQHANIAKLEADLSDAKKEVKQELSDAKKSLSVFGNDHSDMEVSDEIDTVCPSGSAVIGIIHKSN